jgi:hypothetical protein
MASADVRDVERANARNLLPSVYIPKKVGLFGTFKQEPYEENLEKLLRIQDAIEVARLKRESEALAIVVTSKQNAAELQQLVERTQRQAADSRRSSECGRRATNNLPEISRQADSQLAELQRALDTSTVVTISVDELRAAIISLREAASRITVRPAVGIRVKGDRVDIIDFPCRS